MYGRLGAAPLHAVQARARAGSRGGEELEFKARPRAGRGAVDTSEAGAFLAGFGPGRLGSPAEKTHARG